METSEGLQGQNFFQSQWLYLLILPCYNLHSSLGLAGYFGPQTVPFTAWYEETKNFLSSERREVLEFSFPLRGFYVHK